MALSDVLPFLQAWVRNPRSVASIAPSGPHLAELLTREISPDAGPVLELGPGTGAVTRALLARGVLQRDLTLVEYSADFARMLRDRFPEASVLCLDAARLARVPLFGGARAGAVVSGLPLLTMPQRQVYGVLSGVFGHVRADGALYQFTYGPWCPVPRRMLERLGLEARRLGRVARNLPPAGVYRIRRRNRRSYSSD
jgi:phospholipid N-methyltransferase